MNQDKITSAYLYNNFGVNDYFVSIIIKDNSSLLKKYPQTIHGILFYTLKQRSTYKNLDDSKIISLSKNKIRILTNQDLSIKIRNDLQFDGIQCEEIDSVYYIPESLNTDKNSNGLKEIPSEIKIQIDKTDDSDYEGMVLYLYRSYLSRNIPLLVEEKYEYLGIVLALNGEKIDTAVLKLLGISNSEIENILKIWYYYYITKKRLYSLTINEREQLNILKLKFISEKMDILYSELKNAHPKWKEILTYEDQLKLLINEVSQFKTERFGFRDPANYLDLKSYLYIVLRHFNKIQIGKNFLNKTTIPYKLSDLHNLLMSILDILDGDINLYFSSNPSKKFTRHGDMAVYFNGDYYNIDIELDGRISSFYNN